MSLNGCSSLTFPRGRVYQLVKLKRHAVLLIIWALVSVTSDIDYIPQGNVTVGTDFD